MRESVGGRWDSGGVDRDRLLEFQAAQLRLTAAHMDLQAAAIRGGRAMHRLIDTWNAGERRQFESHPDVQEVVAQMRGFYDA